MTSSAGSTPEIETLFADASGGYIVAAAGCGKTELIARGLTRSTGRQLILTHTHAGVRALRARLRKYEVDPKKYSLDTIAGFALRYCLAFPMTSGLSDPRPIGEAWTEVYQAFAAMLTRPQVVELITNSYEGVYVDEYQDCTCTQHWAIVRLAELLPVRIVGDPLQSIFRFGDDPPVDWSSDVESTFERLGELSTPHRWRDTNPELGQWLRDLREALLDGSPLRLGEGPVDVIEGSNVADQVQACRRIGGAAEGTIAGIRRWPPGAHDIASKLSGQFLSMEEMECKDLLRSAEQLEFVHGPQRASVLIDFAVRCMTRVRTSLGVAARRFDHGEVPRVSRGRAAGAVAALIEVAEADSLSPVPRALHEIERIEGVKVYRRELVREMARSVELFESGGHESLRAAAWEVRDVARHSMRRLPSRLISRTLLVKGLEFDHVIVLDANEHGPRGLYVSLSRPSQSLTVLVDPRRSLPGARD